MAMLERTTNPDKKTVGNIGDIWSNVVTGMKYKLVSIIMGTDNRVWYDWQLIDNTAGGSSGSGSGSTSGTSIMTDTVTGKSYILEVVNDKLTLKEV